VVRPGFGHTSHLDYSGLYPDSGEGERYICSIVDSYCSYCWLFPTIDMTSKIAVRCLLHFVSQVGSFKNLISYEEEEAIHGGRVFVSQCTVIIILLSFSDFIACRPCAFFTGPDG